jgi:site-specific DNA-methyltransferase (adenine-specific)
MKEIKDITLLQGDCLELMQNIHNESIDMIFTDLPYGTTQNPWDSIIPFDKLWLQYERIIKPNGCIALWAQSPFDKILASSNIGLYRYEWIIEKTKATGHLNAKKMPMKAHENVLIFYKKLPTYNPQMTEGHTPVHSYTKHTTDGTNYGKTQIGISGGGSTQRYPRDILQFKWDTQKSSLTPTQKPVEGCEYFIKTYTNEGDSILDNCMGSGSIGVAAKKLNRKFIGIELIKDTFNLAESRIKTT